VFCETFLKEEENLDIPGFYGYHRHAQLQNSRWRRGISCFIKPHLGTFSHVQTTDECLIVVLDTMTIACFYCPPQLDVTSFESILFDALHLVPTESNFLVLGDFNARIDPSGTRRNPKTAVLLETLEALDLTLANEPTDITFISGPGSSTIDLVFFDQHFLSLNYCHTMENIQNFKHIPVRAKFTVNELTPTIDQSPDLKPVYKVDEPRFVHLFQSHFLALHELLDNDLLDEAYDQILQLIRLSEAKSQPSQRKAEPWFTGNCYQQRQCVMAIKRSA
jgi:Endonuclease-reverse transcriptase